MIWTYYEHDEHDSGFHIECPYSIIVVLFITIYSIQRNSSCKPPWETICKIPRNYVIICKKGDLGATWCGISTLVAWSWSIHLYVLYLLLFFLIWGYVYMTLNIKHWVISRTVACLWLHAWVFYCKRWSGAIFWRRLMPTWRISKNNDCADHTGLRWAQMFVVLCPILQLVYIWILIPGAALTKMDLHKSRHE